MRITSPDGRILLIHTEVGDGVTRVIVEEAPREAVAIESGGVDE